MKPFRVSIAGVMAFVAISAVGMMGLREGTVLWRMPTELFVLLAIAIATLRAVSLPRRCRGAWAGFAIFAGIYGWAFYPSRVFDWNAQFTDRTLGEYVLYRLHTVPAFPVAQVPALPSSYYDPTGRPNFWSGSPNEFLLTLHFLTMFLVGLAGALTGHLISRQSPIRPAVLSASKGASVIPEPRTPEARMEALP